MGFFRCDKSKEKQLVHKLLKMPLISIITVTFNAENVVEPTLRSVGNQTFTDYEHIIVDGGSKDSTLSIVSSYLNPRLQVHSKPDSGIYHGMNRGLKYARGKYVIFLNAGDTFASADTLSRYAREAEKDADIIYGDTVIVDKTGNILRPRHLSAPEFLSYNSYLKGMLICHQAFMARREIAPEFNREYKLSADYDWCLGCIANSGLTKRHNLKCVTIHYLDGGISQKKKLESLKERFMIMKRRFGLSHTLKAHFSFIPRYIYRILSKKSNESPK